MQAEQHIPIFVGSTYQDLKEHRAKVKDTLDRMETFVHGMEQFGARDESPLETCLNEVRKCKLYVGIFAMRYGSIPDGYDKSMTELEYDEAQRLGLPSFVFIIDEHNGVVNPASIDFENREKLQSFKEKLKKKTVEFFTTPDDLATKVGASIHRAMKEGKAGHVAIDKGIDAIIKTESQQSPETIIRCFRTMPLRWNGIIFSGKFNNTGDGWIMSFPQIASSNLCKAFDLPNGDTIIVSLNLKIEKGGRPHFDTTIPIVASGKCAVQLTEVEHSSEFELLLETAYSDWAIMVEEGFSCILKVKEILSIEDKGDDIPF